MLIKSKGNKCYIATDRREILKYRNIYLRVLLIEKQKKKIIYKRNALFYIALV